MRFTGSLFILCILLSVCFLTMGCSPDTDIFEPESPDPEVPAPPSAEPVDDSLFDNYLKLEVLSAQASEHQPGADIQKALDGDFSTLYHSLWNRSRFPGQPVELTFHFADSIHQIDFMLYHPRKDGGGNGHILEGSVYVRTAGETEYSKYSDFSFANNATSKRIAFVDGLSDPNSIRLVVTRGNNDFVSASQFEFFRMNPQAVSYGKYFTDLSLSELKDHVTRQHLHEIHNTFIRQMALDIFDGTYEEARVGRFQTYPDPSIASAMNKTNRMGSYDNMTGIHARAGEDLIVFVNEAAGDMLLRVVDHHEGYGGQDFILNPGANRITSPVNGLVYIIYNGDHEHVARVNIATGSINGYFDITRHSHEEFSTMLSGTSYGYFDLKGRHAHLTFTVPELRQYVRDATRLVEVYDSIVSLQQEFMGFYKYNRVPPGRLYYRVNTRPGVYMHATGDATEYAPGTLEKIADHRLLRSSAIWGPAHETGHIHQTRPGLMWIGMTEVTVNIYSMHVQSTFGNDSRLQTENMQGYNNRYEKAFAEIISKGIPHNAHGDVFCKLVPFWQLELYFSRVLGQESFYMDVHEMIRQSPDPPNDGMCQLEFVRTVCEVAETDLTAFFRAWGFLTPIDQEINDYSTRRMTITQEQIANLEADLASKGYAVPSAPLQYITDATVGMFRRNEPLVAGQASRTGNTFTMSGWDNVAAFEVYHNEQLIFATAAHAFTIAQLPVGHEVVALGVNGEREYVLLSQ